MFAASSKRHAEPPAERSDSRGGCTDERDPFNLAEGDLCAKTIVELRGAGGFAPGDPGRDLKVCAVPQVLRDPGPAEPVGAELGR